MHVLGWHQKLRKKKPPKHSTGRQRCYRYCTGLPAGIRTSKVAMQRSSGAASRASGRNGWRCFCLCAARDAGRCDYGRRSGRAGTGRIEWRAGRAFYMSMPVFLYTLPSQQPTASLSVPNASLAPNFCAKAGPLPFIVDSRTQMA